MANALKLVIAFVLIVIFSMYYFVIGAQLENTSAPENGTQLRPAWNNNMVFMGLFGNLLYPALFALAGFIVYKVAVARGGD